MNSATPSASVSAFSSAKHSSRFVIPAPLKSVAELEIDRFLGTRRAHPGFQGIDLSIQCLNDLIHVGFVELIGIFVAQFTDYADRLDRIDRAILGQFYEFFALFRLGNRGRFL